EYAEAGSPRLFKLLKLAEIRRTALRRQHAELDALIMLIERLTAAAATLGALMPTVSSPELVARLLAAADNCVSMSRVIADDSAVQAPVRNATLDASSLRSDAPLLQGIEQLTAAIALALRPGKAAKVAAGPMPRQRLLVTDAFTNPVYPHFALKV